MSKTNANPSASESATEPACVRERDTADAGSIQTPEASNTEPATAREPAGELLAQADGGEAEALPTRDETRPRGGSTSVHMNDSPHHPEGSDAENTAGEPPPGSPPFGSGHSDREKAETPPFHTATVTGGTASALEDGAAECQDDREPPDGGGLPPAADASTPPTPPRAQAGPPDPVLGADQDLVTVLEELRAGSDEKSEDTLRRLAAAFSKAEFGASAEGRGVCEARKALIGIHAIERLVEDDHRPKRKSGHDLVTAWSQAIGMKMEAVLGRPIKTRRVNEYLEGLEAIRKLRASPHRAGVRLSQLAVGLEPLTKDMEALAATGKLPERLPKDPSPNKTKRDRALVMNTLERLSQSEDSAAKHVIEEVAKKAAELVSRKEDERPDFAAPEDGPIS